MGKDTGIQWSDGTINPTTGCDGCELWVEGKGGPCYAGNHHETRLARALPALYAPTFTEVRLAPGRMAPAAGCSDLTGASRPDRPWLDGMPRMIFVSDMSDALSKDVPFEYLYGEVVLNVMGGRGRRHLWLWLTKLPRRMAEFARWLADREIDWPENLWAGTSITSEKVVKRVGFLREVPAKVRFLSVEPMWSPIDLSGRLDGISWLICGGESKQKGHACHRFDLSWARSLRDQCRAARVPYFLTRHSRNQRVERRGSSGLCCTTRR
jgi:protein gp37